MAERKKDLKASIQYLESAIALNEKILDGGMSNTQYVDVIQLLAENQIKNDDQKLAKNTLEKASKYLKSLNAQSHLINRVNQVKGYKK